MKKLTKFAAVGVVTMASFAPMSAAALGLSFEGPTSFTENYPQVNTSKTGNEYAGPFNMAQRNDSGDIIDDFVAWCFELGTSLNVTVGEVEPYTTGGVLDDNARGRVQSVFDANYASDGSFFNDRTKGAAFQLAIWEAIYETEETDLSLASGAFSSTTATAGPGDLRDLANGFLTAANDYTGPLEWVITEYKSDSRQDIGTVSPVPLPAAAWLLMFASGGLLAAKRRQARRAA